MIENITQTENGYSATIDGVEMSIPNAAGNRHYSMVQDAIAKGATVVVEHPHPAPIPNLSFSQLVIGMVVTAQITEAEGEAWLTGNGLPQAMADLIAQLPVEDQFIARARALRPTVIERNDPLAIQLTQINGGTSEDMDAFFITFSEY